MSELSRRSVMKAVGAMAVPGSAVAMAGALADSRLTSVMRAPDKVIAYTEDRKIELKASGTRWKSEDVEVDAAPSGSEMPISIRSPKTPVTRVQLRWRGKQAEGWQYLGDAWERSYGDLEWRGLVPSRTMPWYFISTNGKVCRAYGVKTGAAAFCCWQVDSGGVSLWLDIRNGAEAAHLGERLLHAATAIALQSEGSTAFETTRELCRRMCDRPRLPHQPVYGSNNWYYAYGEGFGPKEILRDCEALASFTPPGSQNPPYMVIDMGWADTPSGAGPESKRKKGYEDMAALAAKMSALGTRPGIWTRPLLTVESLPEEWRMPHNRKGGGPSAPQFVIDPSVPEALDHIKKSIKTIAGWGFEMIKHDFSTFDIFGRWGFDMGVQMTNPDWHFADRSRTTAEIILSLYRGIREAAGDTVIIGCNTVGHLAAGLFEVQRIGDDTSGRDWDRTWKMGVNTLAFRAAQHGLFFACDADCVPITPEVPWHHTKQWLDLAANSGTPLFISLDPRSSNPEVVAAVKHSFALAAKVRPLAIPLDWRESTTPEHWVYGGVNARYDWSEGEGLSPLVG